uniref:Prolamin-like domain-containing protein n=1 Tax=Ananas comosus var. bracteatus TaxID=296719 RepID=A0A6V7QAI0_ANACO|nr:unnamed protein product [Ananas comosus var. bracteatus]
MANNENKKEKLFKEILRIDRFEDRQIMDATKILTSDSTKLHIFFSHGFSLQTLYLHPACSILSHNRARSDVVGGSARQPDRPFGPPAVGRPDAVLGLAGGAPVVHGEVILFFLNGETYLGPSCCRAIRVIEHHCWAADVLLASLGFTAQEGDILRGYCDAANDSSDPSTPQPPPAPPSISPEPSSH